MTSDRTLFEPESPAWTAQEWGLAQAKTKQLFNPSQPIDNDVLFSGRIEQASDMLDVVYESGAHAILYGERGVGKSSLANTLAAKIPPQVTNIQFIKDNCTAEDTFFTLWSKMLWNFDFDGVKISDHLKNETRTFVVTKFLESLPKGKNYVFVFDEFDRLKSQETKTAMADLIKHFSDYPQNITIVIIGVSFSIEELFGAHPSIQRCCRQILMPRMSADELSQIILERYEKINITLANGVLDDLIDLSQGLPGFAHLAGREAALSALKRQSRIVDQFDHKEAIKAAVERAHESIISSYEKAVYSPKKNIYKDVLLACAKASRDERGKFSASDVRDELSELLGRRIEISGFARHLAAFCNPERGPVLRKSGKQKGFKYQFIDAPLQPYVAMVGRRDGAF